MTMTRNTAQAPSATSLPGWKRGPGKGLPQPMTEAAMKGNTNTRCKAKCSPVYMPHIRKPPDPKPWWLKIVSARPAVACAWQHKLS